MRTQIPDYLKPLYYLDGDYPREAMHAAIERREETTPILLATLDWTLENAETVADDEQIMLPLYAFYILGHFREAKAREPIMALARHPLTDALLGDVTTEGLGPILAAIFADAPEGIHPLIEDRAADEYARAAGLTALAGLHKDGTLSREALSVYLGQLFDAKLERNANFAWDQAISVATDFDLVEHLPAIKRAYQHGWADPGFEKFEYIEAALTGKPLPYPRSQRYPSLGHPDDELGKWHCFSKKHQKELSDASFRDAIDRADNFDKYDRPIPVDPFSIVSIGATHRREAPKVGRNEPCPCGSGKKFKKCCGA